jgi:hypothetical protein
MKKLLRDEIDGLAAMNVAALQQRHRELFGDQPAPTHRQFLYRKIAWRMQADREADCPNRPASSPARSPGMLRSAPA